MSEVQQTPEEKKKVIGKTVAVEKEEEDKMKNGQHSK